MYKGKSILGKSIVAFNTGKILNRVTDIAYDPTSGKILGLMVDETLHLAKGRHIPMNQLHTIGEDAITVTSNDSIQTWDENLLIKDFVNNKLNLKGRKVMTEEGEDVGTISDIYFLKDGTLEGYEISDGLVSDTYSGTSFLPQSRIAKIGEDVVFVPQSTLHFLNEQVGGIKGKTQDLSEKAKAGMSSTKDQLTQKTKYGMEFMETKVMEPATQKKNQLQEDSLNRSQDMKDSAGNVWEKIKEKVADVKEQSSQQLEEKRIKAALGRPVTRVILDKDDSVILNTGDIITHDAVELAREADMLDALLNSVYTDKPDFSKEELKAHDDESNII